VVVLEVYPAGEEPIPGASGASIAAAIPLPPGQVRFEPSWSAVAQRLAERARPGDIVLTLGAGDVTMIGPEVVTLLAEGGADDDASLDDAGHDRPERTEHS
jgi:UDP-N-acetylmuramate--alanine ligase